MGDALRAALRCFALNRFAFSPFGPLPLSREVSMSDWQVGDLAVCVDAGPPRNPRGRASICLHVGRSYRVTHLHVCDGLHVLVDNEPPHGITRLGGHLGWDANRFRKIRPDAREGSVEDWNLLLETTKRKVTA